jgi:hypothetical protein
MEQLGITGEMLYDSVDDAGGAIKHQSVQVVGTTRTV